jgi:hypothetical protein
MPKMEQDGGFLWKPYVPQWNDGIYQSITYRYYIDPNFKITGLAVIYFVDIHVVKTAVTASLFPAETSIYIVTCEVVILLKYIKRNMCTLMTYI